MNFRKKGDDFLGIKKPNCKVLRHAATLEIVQGAGAFIYFADLTQNHYKAMIDINISNQTGQILNNAQLVVTARDGTDTIIPIPSTTSSASAVIQIEDARFVTLNYTGNPLILGTMNIVKDFCICCPDFDEIHRHESNIEFERDFLFTDLTENHFKAMVVVLGTGTSTISPGQVIVTQRLGTETTIPLPPAGQSAIQIEDGHALSISTRPAPTGSSNSVQITKDFCITCN